jgi:transcriptional regulator with XRE-family HTH domain
MSAAAGASPGAPLPDPAVRRARREGLGLQLSEVAETLGVDSSEVRGWESGLSPAGEVRARYAQFLDAATHLAGLDGSATK